MWIGVAIALSNVILATLCTVITCVSLSHKHVLLERSDFVPKDWIRRDRIERNVILPMRIGLAQRNLDEIEELLMDVSEPQLPRYGQWYSREELDEMFKPSDESIKTVKSWLRSGGIVTERVSLSSNKQWIQFNAEADRVEDLLKTRYHVFEHIHSGRINVACDEYYVPEFVREHIDYITPGLLHGVDQKYLGEHSERKYCSEIVSTRSIQADQKADGCHISKGGIVTPACIRALYNIPLGTLAHQGNQMGIFEAYDRYNPKDLIRFFTHFSPRIKVSEKPPLKKIGAGHTVGESREESNMDLMLSYPITYPQDISIYQVSDSFVDVADEFTIGGFLDAIDGSLCSLEKNDERKPETKLGHAQRRRIPESDGGKLQCGVLEALNVISISYGVAEAELPVRYQRRMCHEFAKLGMQGKTVVAASGDSGVSFWNQCLGKHEEVFKPIFPASCPLVLAVGATKLSNSTSTKMYNETVADKFSPGSGFSNIHPRPRYQDSAVKGYFRGSEPQYRYYETKFQNDPSENITQCGLYNREGRAYPDVSAIGQNIVVISHGETCLKKGTSGSAPLFASVLNRINEERLAKGKKTVGFVHPILYKYSETLSDIRIGNNSGCGSRGFNTSKGWDPVTGLGTPNYPKMLEIFEKLA